MASKTENRNIKIFINGTEVENNVKSINAEFQKTNNILKRMTIGSAEYNAEVKKVNQLSAVLDAHKEKVYGVNKAWEGFKTVFLGTFASNIAQGALQKIAEFFPKIITGAAAIEDSLANVRKTTGLSGDDVIKLNDELGKINTRTSREELRQLATEAGKLGKDSLASVKEFVQQADQIKVALGEDLGDDAILKIGKMSDIFNKSMLQIGSGVNAVGAASSASESYLVDFSARMGGTAAIARIGAGDIIGFGATLDQVGLQAEMSSTALNTFFTDFIKNSEQFGKTAGFAKGELTNLINSAGANEGFLQFLQKLKQANPIAADFLRKLEAMGIDGARGSQVFLSLSENIDKVRAQQLLANTAIEEGNSITTEFNIKNATLGATIDKLGKDLNSLFTSRGIVDAVKGFFGIFISSIDWIKENSAVLKALGKAILSVVSGYIIWQGVLKAKIWLDQLNVIRLHIKEMITQVAATNAVTFAQARQMVVVKSLKTAWQDFTLAITKNPFGILLTAVVTLLPFLDLFSEKTKTAAKEVDKLDEIRKEEQKNTELEIAKIKNLFDLLRQTNPESKRRADLIKQINEKYPAYLKNINDEKDFSIQLDAVQKNLIENLSRLSNARVLEKQLDSVSESILNTKSSIESTTKAANEFKAAQLAMGTPGAKIIAPTEPLIGFFEKQLKDLEVRRAKILASITNAPVTNVAGGTPPTPKGEKHNPFDATMDLEKIYTNISQAQDKYYDGLREAVNRSTDEILAQERNLQNSRINGVELLLKNTKDKYADMAKAAVDSMTEQKAAFQDAYTAQVDALKKVADENNKALADGKNTPAEHAANEKLIADAKIQVELYYKSNMLEIDKQLQNARTNLAKAQAIEEKAIKEQALKDSIAFVKQLNLDLVDQIQTLQIQGSELRANMAGQLMQFAQQRQEINTSLNIQEQQAKEQELADFEKQQAEITQKLADANAGKLGTVQELLDQEANLKALHRSREKQIEDEFEEARRQARMDSIAQQVETYADMANQIMDIAGTVGQMQANKEKSAFAAYKTGKKRELTLLEEKYEAEKLKYKDNLLMQEKSYNDYIAKKTAIENELANKEREMKIKAFQRQKNADIIKAIINTAVAVTSALTIPPPVGYIMAGISAVAGAAQVAAIASQPIPEFEKGGWWNPKAGIVAGAKHSEGGISLVDSKSGRKVGEMEDGEAYAILSGKTARANKPLIDALVAHSMADSGVNLLDELQGVTPRVNISTSMDAITSQRASFATSANSTGAVQFTTPTRTEQSKDDRMDELLMLNREILKTMQQMLEKGGNVTLSQRTMRDYNKQLEITQSLRTFGKSSASSSSSSSNNLFAS